jgi:hypothetical protein
MAAADPSAKWLMQAWLFYDDQTFWQPPQIQASYPSLPGMAKHLVVSANCKLCFW